MVGQGGPKPNILEHPAPKTSLDTSLGLLYDKITEVNQKIGT